MAPSNPIEQFLAGQTSIGKANALQESRELIMDETDDMLDKGPLTDIVDLPLADIGNAVAKAAEEYRTMVTETPSEPAILRQTVRLMGLLIAAYAKVLPEDTYDTE